MVEIRRADVPDDLVHLRRLWHDYLWWGNEELQKRHGFRLPVEDFTDRDIATISKFDPPDGLLLLASEPGDVFGTGALKRIGPDTAEIKRMWVDPAHRGQGAGHAILDRLISTAQEAGYRRIRLDSADFMVAAHALYRSRGFVQIGRYPESEIPDEYGRYWLYMEHALT